MDYDTLTFNPECDYAPVDVLPVDCYDLALQMETGYTPIDCVTANKTYNQASIKEVKGRVCDPFLEMDICRVLHRGSVTSPDKDGESASESENGNSQK